MTGSNNPPRAQWRKSSHSTGGNQCVEVSRIGAAVAIRDSKNPGEEQIILDTSQWKTFLDRARSGVYDR